MLQIIPLSSKYIHDQIDHTYASSLEAGFFRYQDHMVLPNNYGSNGYNVAIRVPLDNLQPSKDMRQSVKRNQDIYFQQCDRVLKDERPVQKHKTIYLRWAQRLGMDPFIINPEKPSSPFNYAALRQNIVKPFDTLSFFDTDHNLAGSVYFNSIDVYFNDFTKPKGRVAYGYLFYFDPLFQNDKQKTTKRKLGIFMLHTLTQFLAETGHTFLYLGPNDFKDYQNRNIPPHRSYKVNVFPNAEAFIDGIWQPAKNALRRFAPK